jgi:hypothetical protein
MPRRYSVQQANGARIDPQVHRNLSTFRDQCFNRTAAGLMQFDVGSFRRSGSCFTTQVKSVLLPGTHLASTPGTQCIGEQQMLVNVPLTRYQ